MTLTANKWIICPKPDPNTRLRLFCFPYAGSGANVFRPWAQKLPSGVEMYAIQLPGRENRLREPLFTQVQPLVQALNNALSPYFDVPFAFFGYSMGAIIGFELARQLRRDGNSNLISLLVAARVAPHVVPPDPPIYQLPRDEFIAKLREFNGTPEAFFQSEELQRMIIPILRADLSVNEAYTYIPEAPLDIPISAFGGQQDKRVSEEHLKSWSEQTLSSFDLQMFPGGHFFIQTAQAPLLEAISKNLQGYLQAVST